MRLIIDSHVHMFPDPLRKLAPGLASGSLAQTRKFLRLWRRPISRTLHKLQTLMRHFPTPALKALDEFGGFAPLPGLLIESTLADLIEAMQDAKTNRAVIIAHPPLCPNELVLDACAEFPRLIPAVNLAPGTRDPKRTLQKYHRLGAKFLKIHPAADGQGVDYAQYLTLIKTACDLGLPIIIHTGSLYSHLLYKDPAQGDAERFKKWFRDFPATFILAHMNMHSPMVAIDLAEEFPNVVIETSWQPAEIIGEAVRRIGAERVIFGSDWPIVGDNIKIGIERIDEAVLGGLIQAEQAQMILGGNATRLFGITEVHENAF
ncbi:amidohydrolase family protein [Bdellovibrionota bacterium FG-2]